MVTNPFDFTTLLIIDFINTAFDLNLNLAVDFQRNYYFNPIFHLIWPISLSILSAISLVQATLSWSILLLPVLLIITPSFIIFPIAVSDTSTKHITITDSTNSKPCITNMLIIDPKGSI